MGHETTSMSENGRILLPIAVRREADIKPREVLMVHVDDQGIHIQTRRQAIRQAQTLVKKLVGSGRSLSAELIAERREEAKRETTVD